MDRKLLLIGTVAAFGFAVAVAGAGDSTRAVACDDATKTAAVSSCCAKNGDAAAASVNNAGTAASLVAAGCEKSAAAAAAAGCDKGAAAAAAAGCDKSAAAAAAAGCDKSAAAAGSAAACDKSKTAAAFNGAVNELPYRENKRVVLTGSYVCGHCTLKVTENCAPLFKTADGEVYPLLKSPEVTKLRGADAGNGVEIASSVKKIDGIKYLDVKSCKTL